MKTVLIGGPLEGIIEQRCSAQYIRVLENDSGYYKISYATGEIRQYVWTPGRVEENFKGTTTLSAVPLSGGAQEGAHWAPPVGTLKPLQMRDSGGVPTPAPPSLEGGPAGSGHPVGSLHPDRAESTLRGLIGELDAMRKDVRRDSEHAWGYASGLAVATDVLERELRTLEEERKAEVRESKDVDLFSLTVGAECNALVAKYGYRAYRILEGMWLRSHLPPPVLDPRESEEDLQDAPSIGTFHTSELQLLAFLVKEGYRKSAPWSRENALDRQAARDKLLEAARLSRADGVTMLWSLEPRESERTES
jgi:hypothetical protein